MGKKALFVLFLLSSFSSLANTIMEKTSTLTNKEYVTMESLEPDNTDMTLVRDRDEIIRDLINNMVRIEGGTFRMGATSKLRSGAYDDERPTHKVTLSSFSINKFEVTQEEYEAVLGYNTSHFKGKKKPVEKVDWDDCQAFIQKLNDITGMDFRLPTEAEWEYAARGGNKSNDNIYAGSNTLLDVAWFDAKGGTHEVGSKLPNELGLYDMSGNVWEWCQDWYGEYDSDTKINPEGPPMGTKRVIRGGCWGDDARSCRVTCRNSIYPDTSIHIIGFRLALQ